MKIPDSDSDSAFGYGVFYGVCLSILIGSLVCTTINLKWESEAIRHQAARYNETSGCFEWINPETKP